MSKMKFAFLLALAPVMMGSDYDSIGYNREELKVTGKLPVCNQMAGELLTYQGGNLICAVPPGNGISGVTKCDGQLLSNLGAGGEFKTLSCTPKGGASISNSDITRVTTLSNNVTTLSTTVNNLMAAAPSRGYFIGLSATIPANGMFIVPGSDYGMDSANGLCKTAARPKAHVCTAYEIYASAAAGKDLSTVQNVWIYNASWNKNSVNPADPDKSVAENCGGFTYSSADLQWKGTTATYGPLGSPLGIGLKFDSVACSSGVKAACCD